MIKKCRWGIIGTGAVAGKFVIGLRSTPGAEVSLVASRSAERAASFAAQLGIERSVGSYERAAADIDVAYIATPPSEHRDNALLFINAGTAVLIEKPFAANTADAEAIIKAAQAANVFCMEGMWTRFLPAMQLARTLVADGRIGTPRTLSASFAIANIVDPADSFFRPELGGGVLGHRGVYPISLAVDLLGPAALVSAAVATGETGVDEEARALLRHPHDAVSMIYASARTTADNDLVLMGTEGTMRLAGPIVRPFGVEIETLRPRRRSTVRWSQKMTFGEGPLAQGLRRTLGRLKVRFGNRRFLRAPFIGNGYVNEAMAAMEALAEGRTEHALMPLKTSLAIVRLIDEIRTTSIFGP
jgi:predicted dehydrogenase